MKTNHQRDFVADHYPGTGENYQRLNIVRKLPISGKVVSAGAVAGDACKGKHGIAKSRRGAKKFIASRTRLYERMAIEEMLKGNDDETRDL